LAKEFAKNLPITVTISFLRRVKGAITLGKDARPIFSKILTTSEHVQINSITQTGNLKRGLKAD
jgi:hypothetical protein